MYMYIYMDDFHEVYLLDISLQSQLYMLKLPHSTKVLGLNPPQLALTFIEFFMFSPSLCGFSPDTLASSPIN